jgi:hypothetical protein
MLKNQQGFAITNNTYEKSINESNPLLIVILILGEIKRNFIFISWTYFIKI